MEAENNPPKGFTKIEFIHRDIYDLYRMKFKVSNVYRIESFNRFRDLVKNDVAIFKAEWGFLELSGLVPGFKANCHGIFTSHTVYRHTEDIRKLCCYVLKLYGIIRLECKIPVKMRSLGRLLESSGFQFEGVLRMGIPDRDKGGVNCRLYSFIIGDCYG